MHYAPYCPRLAPNHRRELRGRIVLTNGLAMSGACVAMLMVMWLGCRS